MRPSNKSRSRNKPGNNGNPNNPRRGNLGNIINRVFESAGPDGKVRGTPQQIIDKYQALARDAQVSGDRVAAESYLQHSEHYSRLLGEAQRQQMESRFNPDREDGPRDDGFDHQRRPQPSVVLPVASGLTTIDPDDPFEMVGPIETPEGRRQQPTSAPEPFAVAGSVPNGGGQPAARPAPEPEPQPELQPERPAEAAEPVQAQAAAPAPAKRPRRRPRAEAPAPAARAE
jgi:hypothetical protein